MNTPSITRNLKYTVKFNGIVTSVSIKRAIVALFLTVSDCKIDPQEFMRSTVNDILYNVSAKSNKMISEIVTYKLLEMLLDGKKDIKKFYRYAAKL